MEDCHLKTHLLLGWNVPEPTGISEKEKLESQGTLRVSFILLNEDVYDPDVSMCKNEAASAAARQRG